MNLKILIGPNKEKKDDDWDEEDYEDMEVGYEDDDWNDYEDEEYDIEDLVY